MKNSSIFLGKHLLHSFSIHFKVEDEKKTVSNIILLGYEFVLELKLHLALHFAAVITISLLLLDGLIFNFDNFPPFSHFTFYSLSLFPFQFHSIYLLLLLNYRFHIDKRCQHRCSWKCLSFALIAVAVILAAMLAYFAGKLYIYAIPSRVFGHFTGSFEFYNLKID